MRNSLKLASNLLILAAITLGCAGTIAYTGVIRAMTDSGQLVIEGDSPTFGEAVVGSEPVIHVRLRNRTSRPIRLLGSTSFCHKVACFKATELPQTIPAGAVGEIAIHVTARSAGDFSGSFDIFTDRPGRTEFPIEIRGRVIDPYPNSDSPSVSSLRP